MNTVLLLVIALLPAILLWLYIWKKDPQKEPTGKLIKAVLWGVAICIPVAFLELVIQQLLFGGEEPTNLLGTTTMAFLVAAVPEESAKLYALWLILRKNPYFDEHFDGIVYAVCVGLGFAAIENVFYLIDAGDEWVTVGISRALLAVPGHYAFAVIMGFYYSVYHFVDHSKKNAIYILLIPVIAHGIYDTIAFSATLDSDSIFIGICALLLIFFCVRMHKFAKKKIVAQLERDEQEPLFAQEITVED